MAATLRKVSAKVKGHPTVRVGFFETARYDDGTPVAMVAAIQEFGAPSKGIPPRPFFRTMIAKHRDEWAPKIGGILAHNGMDVKAALAGMGQIIAGDLHQSIVDLLAPPLSPVTIMVRWIKARDGRAMEQATFADVLEARARVAAGKTSGNAPTKPLVDTGLLLKSIGFEVNAP